MPLPRSSGNAGIALATVSLFPISRMTSPGAMPVRLMSAGSRRARPRPTSFARASVALRIRSPGAVALTASPYCAIAASLRRPSRLGGLPDLAASGVALGLCSIGAFVLPHRDVSQIPQLEPQREILVLQAKMGLEFVHALLQPEQRQSQALDVIIRQVAAFDATDGLTLDQLTQRLDQSENQAHEIVRCGFAVGGDIAGRRPQHHHASGARTVTKE